MRSVLQFLVGIGRFVSHDFLYRTIQYPTQIVDGRGVQRFVFSQFIDGGTGQVMFDDQRISRFVRCFERFPKRLINDHPYHLLDYSII